MREHCYAARWGEYIKIDYNYTVFVLYRATETFPVDLYIEELCD